MRLKSCAGVYRLPHQVTHADSVNWMMMSAGNLLSCMDSWLSVADTQGHVPSQNLIYAVRVCHNLLFSIQRPILGLCFCTLCQCPCQAEILDLPLMNVDVSRLGRVQQLTGRIGQTIGTASAVRQFSSLSSRTKWQRLPAGDTLRSVSLDGNRCHFVPLDNDESCPTADLSNIGRPNGLPFGRPMLDWSPVGQLSSLSSGTKWQRLPASDNTMYSVVAYSTSELLHTPLITHHSTDICSYTVAGCC